MRNRASAVPPEATSRLAAVATFKPAYLIHGDDHGRIGERRARLRAIAEAESGAGGVEVFEGDAVDARGGRARAPRDDLRDRAALPHRRRRRAVEGRRCRERVAPALAGMAPDTTVAFFAREEGRAKAPAKLGAAVKKAGGDVVAESALKPRSSRAGCRRG